MARNSTIVLAALPAAAALIYGVGYLIVSMFHSHWGIMDTRPIRAPYIHVGFLCVTPPFVFGALVCLYRSVKCKPTTGYLRDAHVLGLYVLCVLVGTLYYLALFAQPSTFGKTPVQFALVALPLGSVGGLLVMRGLVARLLNKLGWKGGDNTITSGQAPNTAAVLTHFTKVQLRGLFLLLTLVASGVLIGHANTAIVQLCSQQWFGASLYVVLSALLVSMCLRVITSWPQVDPHNRLPMLIACLAMFLPLSYFAVLAFAYGVYRIGGWVVRHDPRAGAG